MPKTSESPAEKYTPKHRAAPARTRALGATGKAARKGIVFTSVAVAATGIGVGGGVVVADGPGVELANASADVAAGADSGSGAADQAEQAADQGSQQNAAQTGDDAGQADDPAALSAAEQQELLADRGVVSRSDRRDRGANPKQAALTTASDPAVTVVEDLSGSDPRDIAKALLPEYGFGQDQFSCLDSLYMSESGWRVNADNPSSSAYGIPQAMTSVHDMPADYYTSAESQIRWGLEYIQRAYGTPCSAWGFKSGHGWY